MRTLYALLFFAGLAVAQGATPVDCTPATLTFTSATAQNLTNNNANNVTPCRSWEITYDAPSTVSALSLQFETSQDNSSWTAVPNNICSSTQQPPCVIDGSNPSTTTLNQTFSVSAYGKFNRINVTSKTGSGTITVRVYGYKGLSARVRNTGGGGSGGSMTIAGTTNQIAVSGTCNDTAGTCVVKLPNPSVTIDATTGAINTPGPISSGVGSNKTGAVFETGTTDGKSQGFSVNDTAGVSILYLMPAVAGAASQALFDTGVTTCPTLAAGSPAVCHQLAWTSAGGTNYQTIDSNGSALPGQPTVNFISGTNATVTCVNNGGATRTDCTVAATAGAAAPVFPVNAQTATYQTVAADFTNFKTIAVASGTFTITMVASGSQPASGTGIWIVNYGSGTITVARSGQNINGAAANLTIAAGSASAPNGMFIVSDGTNYIAQPLIGSSAGGSGSFVLVEQHTAANSAELDFTSCISATYDDYVIRFHNMLPATNSAQLNVQVSTDGGATYDTGANYTQRLWIWTSGGTQNIAVTNTAIFIGGSIDNTGPGTSGHFDFFNPAATTTKQENGQWTTQDGAAGQGGSQWGTYNSNTAVNAFRLIMSAGNITSGTARCYGIAH